MGLKWSRAYEVYTPNSYGGGSWRNSRTLLYDQSAPRKRLDRLNFLGVVGDRDTVMNAQNDIVRVFAVSQRVNQKGIPSRIFEHFEAVLREVDLWQRFSGRLDCCGRFRR